MKQESPQLNKQTERGVENKTHAVGDKWICLVLRVFQGKSDHSPVGKSSIKTKANGFRVYQERFTLYNL